MSDRHQTSQSHAVVHAKEPASPIRFIGYRKSGAATGTGLSHYVLLRDAATPAAAR